MRDSRVNIDRITDNMEIEQDFFLLAPSRRKRRWSRAQGTSIANVNFSDSSHGRIRVVRANRKDGRFALRDDPRRNVFLRYPLNRVQHVVSSVVPRCESESIPNPP